MTAESLNMDDLCLTDPAFFGRRDPDDLLRRLRKDDPARWIESRL
jgi:hypothetical protein